jgi:eIF-2B alpha/beta/delta-like uncharacterized protein
MTSAAVNLQSLKYSNIGGSNPQLQVLDQLLVPHEKVYIPIPDVTAAWTVIQTMQIRGAPLIAIVALLGLSVDLHTNPITKEEFDKLPEVKALEWIQEKMVYLKSSRPTAVNLSNALLELDQAMTKALQEQENNESNATKDILKKVILEYSEFMLERDVSDNRAIGKFGAEAILKITGKDKINLVTICNTGSLATAGYGTALGVARSLQEVGKLESITALETRPYNQGSRLTAFEILEEKMPGGQLICDAAVGALMQVRNTSRSMPTNTDDDSKSASNTCLFRAQKELFLQSYIRSDQASRCLRRWGRSSLCQWRYGEQDWNIQSFNCGRLS